MKAKEFDLKKRDPNWRAMQDIRRSGAGGQHKDKKKAAKQGDVKHKGKNVEEGIGGTIAGGIGQFIGNKIDPLHGEIMRAHGEMAGRKAEYTIRKYMHLLQKALKQQLSSDVGNENMEEAQDDWGGMSHKEFKRRELQHELGHEDDPDFERKMRQQQMDRDKGPWYIRINGKIYKQKGEPKVFDWKKGANNYALAILKNKPDLQGKILLTKNPADQ